jgi:hypothetical protein
MMAKGPSSPDFDSFEWDEAEEQNEQDLFSATLPLETNSTGQQSEEYPGGEGAQAAAPDQPVLQTAVSPPARLGRRGLDPALVYWILIGLSLGLTPLARSAPVGRYTIMWTLLALASLSLIMLRSESPPALSLPVQELVWGAGWGGIVGLPLLLVGATPLAEASTHIFVGMPDGAVFQSIVFVMVTTETIFFRGLIQKSHSILMTAFMAAGWSIVMFFPTMDVFGYPSIALIVGTFLVMLSIFYSYVRRRNGLAAAWLCQTLISLAWLFLPRLIA